MCQYSATAENMRDAREGEDLVIAPAPHGTSKWLTEPGKPECAVCVPHTAVLAVQRPESKQVRGALFEQREGRPDRDGNVDFLKYVDGPRERVALNALPLGTMARVLRNFHNGGRLPEVPAVIGAAEKEMVSA